MNKGGVITEKYIKPGMCTVAFAMPQNQAAFNKDCEDNRKNLARDLFYGIWGKYCDEFLNPFKKGGIEAYMKRAGVKLVYDVTLDDYGRLFHDEGRPVDILFAHWYEECVEFYDGFATVDQILDKIPDSFSGIVDLNVCHPTSLVEEIGRKKGNCVVRSLYTTATPYLWLHVYVQVFKIMEAEDITYIDALNRAIRSILDAWRKKE
ncbi:MAG: hypothetical protein HQK99_12985 [Nitrospirae bacterium]|nr:hypothetical protein [Nitrospirota bacterium]